MYDKYDDQDSAQPGDESAVDALEVMQEWRATWLRAIAIAWNDNEFKNRLLQDCRQAFSELGFTGRASFINKKGIPEEFNLWDRIDIKVVDSSKNEQEEVIPIKAVTSSYTPLEERITHVSKDKPLKNGWKRVIYDNKEMKTITVFQLPPKPDIKDQSIAIADYEAAGKIFPFTSS